MSNRGILFMVAILIFFALASAARPDFSLAKAQKEGAVDVAVEAISCEGMDEEECLVRRSLQAHTDYIYTQAHTDYIYTQGAKPTPAHH